MYYGVYSSLILVPGDTLKFHPRNSEEGAYFSRLASTGSKGAFIPSLDGNRSKTASIVSVARVSGSSTKGPVFNIVCTGRIVLEQVVESDFSCLLIKGRPLQDRVLKRHEVEREGTLHSQALACLRLLFDRFGLPAAQLAKSNISPSELAWLLCSSDLASSREKAWCLERTDNLERLEFLIDAAQRALVASVGSISQGHLVN